MPLKAVISAAGLATRFFPLTKVLNKTLLPILDRPIIDYLVTDLVGAGVRDVAVVTLPGDDQIRAYFGSSPRIDEYVRARGWEEKCAPLAALAERFAGVRFTYLEQPLEGGYGTAIPALLAREFVGEDDWFLLTSDDIVLRPDGGSDLADMVRERERCRARAAMAVTEVPVDDVSAYGIVATRRHGDHDLLRHAVEKPAPADAPSRLASISRFLIGPDFFLSLEAVEPNPGNGEYQSITALTAYAQANPVLVHRIAGTYYDCGQPAGWLRANQAAAAEHGLT